MKKSGKCHTKKNFSQNAAAMQRYSKSSFILHFIQRQVHSNATLFYIHTDIPITQRKQLIMNQLLEPQ